VNRVVEQVTVREVVGIFHSQKDMEEAFDVLLRSGFDRADVDIMASAETVRQKLGTMFLPAEAATENPNTPRQAFVTRDDVTIPAAGVAGILFYVGATAAALAVVASGGTLAAALAAVALGGTVGGGLGALAARFIGREHARALETELAAGGLVVWVRVRSPELERRAIDILRGHFADGVRAHDITVDKRIADLPLASLRPDPWLSEERLGGV
jgi:hypothetical protein